MLGDILDLAPGTAACGEREVVGGELTMLTFEHQCWCSAKTNGIYYEGETPSPLPLVDTSLFNMCYRAGLLKANIEPTLNICSALTRLHFLPSTQSAVSPTQSVWLVALFHLAFEGVIRLAAGRALGPSCRGLRG